MASDVVLEKVRQIVSTIFDVPLERVTDTSSPADIEAWDSMGALALTLELEQEFDVQLSPEQTESMNNVQAIADGLRPMVG